jgi:guanylate kinase
VGKGTLIRRVLEAVPGLSLSVSATTRAKREGEVEGRDYFFLTPEEFRRAAAEGEFLEWAEYAGNLYGTPRKKVEEELAAGRDAILEIELEGARQVAERCPDALLIFIMPPSLEELRRRLVGRNTETEESLSRRLSRAQEETAAVQQGTWEAPRQFDYVIVNDTVERASDELADIIRRTRKNHEQTNGR